METGIQIACSIQLTVFGIAHLFRPQVLIEFYSALNSKGEAGVVVLALLSLFSGSFLVAFHNIWAGIPMLLTLVGWSQLIKGTLYLLFPSLGLRFISKVTPQRSNAFRLPAIPLLGVAAALVWHLANLPAR